jgi:hypothetical protein
MNQTQERHIKRNFHFNRTQISHSHQSMPRKIWKAEDKECNSLIERWKLQSKGKGIYFGLKYAIIIIIIIGLIYL